MTRPLKVDVTTSPKSLKEMTDTELEYISNLVAADFQASTDGTLTGELNIDGSGTLIGTFVDTSRPNAVGSHPVGTTVNSTTYNIYQVLTPATEDANAVFPLTYSPELEGLQEIDLATSDLGTNVLDSIEYMFQVDAPDDGGTWYNVGTITDSQVDGGGSSASLWKKVSNNASITEPENNYRPIRLDGDSLKELTDDDLKKLMPYIQNNIVNTGIGKYAFSSTAPETGGTWVQMGTGLADTRQTVANVSYTRYYSGYVGGYYTGLTVQNSEETVTSAKFLWKRIA